MFAKLLGLQAIWTGIVAFLGWVYLGKDTFVDWVLFILTIGVLLGTMYYFSYEKN